MKSKYLMNCAAAMLIGFGAAGCSHDFDFSVENEKAAMDNAKATLGFTIPADQDWVMSDIVSANMPIPGEAGETYTVKVYSNDPLVEGIGYYLAKANVVAGSSFVDSFRYPNFLTSFVVGLTDSKGETTYKMAEIVNGQISSLTDYVAKARTRSQVVPAAPGITAPYDEAWVAEYLTTAKEPTTANVADNHDDTTVAACQWYATANGKLSTLMNNYDYCVNDNSPVTQADKDWYTTNIKPLFESYGYYNWTSEHAHEILMKLKEYTGDYNYWNLTVNSEGGLTPDPDFVRNFKITGTWDGDINVVASEGIMDNGTLSNSERTVVVTGTWNVTEDQRVGSLGKVIIANGGTVNVASDKMMNFVNQARLVVLPGGKLTGAGKVEVNNGNAAGQENYNGGLIDVAVFNNNFGKFYNYGQFKVTEYQGGAQESNFYNHALVSIKHTGLGSETPNARIFNACQWYCEGDMRCRNYEGVMGSSFIVGGQLMVSSSEDGTSTPSYFGLAAGALVKVGSLYNNGTSWTGPTSGGFAALEIDNQIDFLNWEQDHPENGGYFENNIYVKAGNWSNIPGGNGYQAGETATADYKFWNIVANCRGNNGVTKVNAGDTELLPADSDFELGVKGCTPGFKGGSTPPTPPTPPSQVIETPNIWSYAFEDNTSNSDYDMNDVVLKVQLWGDTQLKVWLVAAGCEYDNRVYLGETKLEFNSQDEVHDALGADHAVLVNTQWRNGVNRTPVYCIIDKPAGFDPQTAADFRIAPAGGNIYNNYVNGSGDGFVKVAGTGMYPCGIMIPVDWSWPTERTNICDAYSTFRSWATDPTHSRDTDWYINPTRNVTNVTLSE